SVMSAIPAEIFEEPALRHGHAGGDPRRRRAVWCHGKAIRPRSGLHGEQHPVDASDLACSPTASPTSSTTDWTLARAAHRPLLVDRRRLFLRVWLCGAGAPEEISDRDRRPASCHRGWRGGD